MSTLSNTACEAIMKAALDARFAERQKALDAQEEELALDCYNRAFPEAVRQAAASLPKGWLRRDECLRMTFGYRTTTLRTSSERAPLMPQGGCQILIRLHDQDLIDRFDALTTARDAFKSEWDKAVNALRSLLRSARTVKQLAAAWPEGEPYYRFAMERAKAGLPVVTSDEVNAILGLKKAA
jgi:hypothetical protein